MPNPRTSARRLSVVFLLCGATVLWAAQKKTPAQRSVATPSPEPAPIAVHEYQLEGVDLALMEVMRTAPGVVTVKWEYRNKTKEPQKLATVSHGWSDPYRLCWDSYLLGRTARDPQLQPCTVSRSSPLLSRRARPSRLGRSMRSPPTQEPSRS